MFAVANTSDLKPDQSKDSCQSSEDDRLAFTSAYLHDMVLNSCIFGCNAKKPEDCKNLNVVWGEKDTHRVGHVALDIGIEFIENVT